MQEQDKRRRPAQLRRQAEDEARDDAVMSAILGGALRSMATMLIVMAVVATLWALRLLAQEMGGGHALADCLYVAAVALVSGTMGHALWALAS